MEMGEHKKSFTQVNGIEGVVLRVTAMHKFREHGAGMSKFKVEQICHARNATGGEIAVDVQTLKRDRFLSITPLILRYNSYLRSAFIHQLIPSLFLVNFGVYKRRLLRLISNLNAPLIY